jgi:hypothetical protein
VNYIPQSSNEFHLASSLTPSLYHCVATHLSPPRTGQPLCSVSADIFPLELLYERVYERVYKKVCERV